MNIFENHQVIILSFDTFAWIARITGEDLMAQGATPQEALARLAVVKEAESK